MKCRHCAAPLDRVFLDLGFAPPSNAYLTSSDLLHPEAHYPLKVMVCSECWLVQTADFAKAESLFNADYAYFSSTSATWTAHAAAYVTQITGQLGLDSDNFVLEIASNDGYLLRNFARLGIPCLGVEPTASTAAVAEAHGIPVLREFFTEKLGERIGTTYRRADLIIGNNVYAHVPDINDFTRGIKAALAPGGTVTLEFPHLMRLLDHTQFDTIYHEHFSYFSLYTATRIFETAGLRVFDVEALSTHGGSLRVYGCHETDPRRTKESVRLLTSAEAQRGLQSLYAYAGFQSKADRIKDDILLFLIEAKRTGKKVAAYGAAAKGNTLLNYAGIKPDLLPFVCDAAPAKQGKFLPGSHIPIKPPDALTAYLPDYVLILPWNIADEVKQQNALLTRYGTKFVTAVPQLVIA